MNNVAIILGAGNGTRMKSDKSKLLLDVGGMTVIERTVKTFSSIPFIDEVIVVCREFDFNAFEEVLGSYDVNYCFGGKTRQESVSNAIETIDECDYVIIHDGARPLITEEEILRTVDKAYEYGAAAVGVPVKDTIKVVDGEGIIVDTPDRSKLVAIRTPQIFKFDLYKKAMELAKKEEKDFTDDCALIENYGEQVCTVTGDYGNIKITTPEDIPVAMSILKSRGEIQ